MIFAKSLIAAALTFVAAQAAHLSKENYKGVLSPLLEVPAVTTSHGKGTFEVTAKFATKINYEIKVSGLTSPITAMHFHSGSRDESGPVVATILGETIDDTEAKVTGEITVDLETYQLFLDGSIYINVHTVDIPSGEVRGQVDTHDLKVYTNKLVGSGTIGNGVTTVCIDEMNTVAYEVNVHKTESSLQAMHFHEGGPGENGGVFYTIDISDVMNKKKGTVTGSFIATDEQTEMITDEGAYINVHTFKFPSGEIRAEIGKERKPKALRG